MSRPRTLQIFLPNGNLSSLQFVKQTASIMGLTEVPRRDLGQAPHRPIPLKAECEEMREISRLLLTKQNSPIANF